MAALTTFFLAQSSPMMTSQVAANFTGHYEAPQEPNDKCLNDLRLTNPRDDKERIKDTKGSLLEGSYNWILDQSDFQRWRNDDQSRLL
ncbi:unnamed protein product [Penicillium manginii]